MWGIWCSVLLDFLDLYLGCRGPWSDLCFSVIRVVILVIDGGWYVFVSDVYSDFFFHLHMTALYLLCHLFNLHYIFKMQSTASDLGDLTYLVVSCGDIHAFRYLYDNHCVYIVYKLVIGLLSCVICFSFCVV